ncbi:MAG TPA: cytochrome c peroxidase [Myxococcota bacterium]|nr:cytochrome c peroxidase [Myxococcota bacterium]
MVFEETTVEGAQSSESGRRSKDERARALHGAACGWLAMLGVALAMPATAGAGTGGGAGHDVAARRATEAARGFVAHGARGTADGALRVLLRRHGVGPARDADFAQASPELVALGNLLFYDKLLSGNRDVSCATCHHALMATADGVSLPAGVGGRGLSTARAMGEGRERVPRNAPEVFNRGHVAFTNMFWDGRIERDASQPSGFRSPAGADLPAGFASALEVQAMFPVTSAAEMRGDPGENEIADAGSLPEVWARLMDRLLAIDEYRERFAEAFPDTAESELGFEHAARAIAAFEATRWRADGSPFDRYLRGDRSALGREEKRGALLFYGSAGCASCHSGTWQTDLAHHAIAEPQIGPGKGHGPDGDEDFGREAISGDATDRFRFRTPPLRNVALTSPYGHAGAHRTLEDVVRHHLDPVASLEAWDPAEAMLPVTGDEETPFSVMEDAAKRDAIADANELRPRSLSDDEVDALVAFLEALTDPRMLDLREEVPPRVPSGLPLAD